MVTATRRRPAIVPQHPTWFRVMRTYRIGTEPVRHECIGEFSDASTAVVFASQEPTMAFVTRWDSKRVYDNGKTIEQREAAPRPTAAD